MGRRPLPAMRDLTRDGRWSTYNVSVLKLYNVSFRGRCARTGHPHQAGRAPCRPAVFYVYVFSLVETIDGASLSSFVQGLDLGDEGLLVGAGHSHAQHQLQDPDHKIVMFFFRFIRFLFPRETICCVTL